MAASKGFGKPVALFHAGRLYDRLAAHVEEDVDHAIAVETYMTEPDTMSTIHRAVEEACPGLTVDP